MSTKDDLFIGVAIPVVEPGEDFDGTFNESMVSVFGATEDALIVAADENRTRQDMITENQRRAAIRSRTIFIGSTATH